MLYFDSTADHDHLLAERTQGVVPWAPNCAGSLFRSRCRSDFIWGSFAEEFVNGLKSFVKHHGGVCCRDRDHYLRTKRTDFANLGGVCGGNKG